MFHRPTMDHQKLSTYRVSKNSDASRSRRRERYTRVACESCKIRKVRCSGNMPCSRCVELRGECKYPLLEHAMARKKQEPRRGLGASSQNLTELLSAMKKICNDIESSANHLGSIPAYGHSLKRRHIDHHNGTIRSKLPQPTNLVYPVDLARACLEERRAASTTSTDHDHHIQLPPAEMAPSTDMSAVTIQAAQVILDIGYDEVLQHVATFNHEIYPMYPCISLEFAGHEIEALFAQLSPSATAEHKKFDMDLIDIEIMKAILAISMLTQSQSQSPLCADLEAHLIWNVDVNMKQDIVQIEDIIMATLMVIYFILRDQAVKAWRMSGVAAKACLELGLHKERAFDICDNPPPDAVFLQDIFLCVYDLDKRCSFYTNLPWTLHDKDIDENVFDLNGRHPYLSAMVRLDRIHSEIVEVINSSQTVNTKEIDERAEFLGYRLEKLVESMNEREIFPPQSPGPLPPPTTQAVMEAFVALRTTHIRLFTHIRSLSSAETFSSRPKSAHMLISLAISSVDLHSKMIAAGGYGSIPRLLQSTIHKLLTTSLSCMFLAASYNPQVFGSICCRAFHAAIDILNQAPRSLSGHGADTVWSSLEDLRRIGESIQMPEPDKQEPIVGPPRMDICPSAMQRQQIEPSFDQDNVFTPQEATDHEFLASIGEIYSNYDFPVEQLGFA